MLSNTVNNELFRLYEQWLAQCYKKKYWHKGYSFPFFLKVSEEYQKADCTKRIMIIGQETHTWGTWNPNLIESIIAKNPVDIAALQNLYEEYLTVQFHPNHKFKCNSPTVNRSNGYFWKFMREIHFSGFSIIWNNITKLDFNGGKITDMEAKDLVGNFEKETLFQREIELLKPHKILFVNGPYYAQKNEMAFGRKFDSSEYPTKVNQLIIDHTKQYLWTYHPQALHFYSKDARENIMSQIIENLKEI